MWGLCQHSSVYSACYGSYSANIFQHTFLSHQELCVIIKKNVYPTEMEILIFIHKSRFLNNTCSLSQASAKMQHALYLCGEIKLVLWLKRNSVRKYLDKTFQ